MNRSPSTKPCGSAAFRPAFFALLLVMGCTPSEQRSGDQEAQDWAHRLEHHTPAHRPADVAAAVAAVRRYHTTLLGADAKATDESFSEYGDVAAWLPEIAADSDLPEQPWNELQARATQLASFIPPLGDDTSDRLARYRSLAPQIEPLLADLEAIVAAGTWQEPAYSPGSRAPIVP